MQVQVLLPIPSTAISSKKALSNEGADTIAAIATPLGEGALGIVRLSGPQAIVVAGRVFVAMGKRPLANQKSHTLRHGWLMQKGHKIDEVMVAMYRSPSSYTGEDIVEIIGHGGYAVLRAVLSLLLENGARLAEPGEFTKRAFLNGKMDLAQAEAVMELIQAKSEIALQAGLSSLQGGLSRRIRALREEILAFYAPLEAAIDFPEEDIEGSSLKELTAKIKTAAQKVQELRVGLQGSRVQRNGIKVTILGRPNAGKSSLFNALLSESRALVSEVAGTTRDAIEETVTHSGYGLCFVDTAGIRAGAGKIETQGIALSLAKAQKSDIVLYLVDQSRALHPKDKEFVSSQLSPEKGMIVFTKTDLPPKITTVEGEKWVGKIKSCCISAWTGEGLVALKDEIVSLVTGSLTMLQSSDMTANTRQIETLAKIQDGLEQAAVSCREKQSYECIALDLSRTLHLLGEITGETASEELLHAIFSRFCIGK